MDDVPRGEFAFDAGGALVFAFASRKPAAGDRSSDVRIGPGRRPFAAERAAVLHALGDRLRAARGETNGVEVFAPTGDRSVAFRDPDNIQLEY
jgi:catechol 2,3-dioxygenase-like lactoylglutathione lyase family enzyme